MGVAVEAGVLMSPQVTGTVIDIDRMPGELSPVFAYWESLIPDGAIGPSWPQFNLMKVPSPFLPFSTVVDYDNQTATFRYRFWGRSLTDVFRNDYTGKTFEELPDRFQDATIQTYSVIIESKKPSLAQFSIDDPKMPVRFEQALRLPLSNDGNTVSNIFSILMYPWERGQLKCEAEKHIWND